MIEVADSDQPLNTNCRSVAIQTELSCFDETSPIAITASSQLPLHSQQPLSLELPLTETLPSSKRSCTEMTPSEELPLTETLPLSNLPCTEMPPSSELPCIEIPELPEMPPSPELPFIEMSSLPHAEVPPSEEQPHIQMPLSPEPALQDLQLMMEIQSTPAQRQSTGNPINLFGYLQQPLCSDTVRLCEGNNDKEFQPLIEKYKGRFKNNSGMRFFMIDINNMSF